MKKSIILTKNAPAPIGPYSQAVEAGGMLYISGQVAIDPKTGAMRPGNLRAETELVMQNLRAILEFAGLNFRDVVKTTIFLAPGQAFETVNEVYASYLDGNFPARETVWVQQLPKDAKVEISMIAAV